MFVILNFFIVCYVCDSELFIVGYVCDSELFIVGYVCDSELFIVGYGHSDKEHVEDKAKFLEDLIKVVNFTAPVIISPSMSGSFALPYLLSDPKTADKKSHGFIPVAPVDINKYTDKYKDLQVNHITHVLADTNVIFYFVFFLQLTKFKGERLNF
jgi:hypothetical protein